MSDTGTPAVTERALLAAAHKNHRSHGAAPGQNYVSCPKCELRYTSGTLPPDADPQRQPLLRLQYRGRLVQPHITSLDDQRLKAYKPKRPGLQDKSTQAASGNRK